MPIARAVAIAEHTSHKYLPVPVALKNHSLFRALLHGDLSGKKMGQTLQISRYSTIQDNLQFPQGKEYETFPAWHSKGFQRFEQFYHKEQTFTIKSLATLLQKYNLPEAHYIYIIYRWKNFLRF